MEIKRKIQLYHVKQRGSLGIDEILSHLDALSMEERIRSIGGHDIKVEVLDRLNSGLCFANFSKKRDVGPGKSSPNEVTRSFDLKEEEGFSEVTSILLSKNRKFVMVEYNHYGTKASKIAHYLSHSVLSANANITFKPVLRRDIKMKIEMADSLGMIEGSFDFSNRDLPDYARRVPQISRLFETLRSFDERNATRIQVKISKRRGKFDGIRKDSSENLLDTMVRLSDENIVTSAKVEARYDDRPNEMLNLLEAIEEVTYDIKIDEDAKMIPPPKIKETLERAYNHWLKKETIDDVV